MALQFFGVLQAFHRLAVGFGSSTFAMSLRSLLTTRSRAAPLAFGVFNGFLPCPLVYAFAAEAASTSQSASGVSHHGVVRTGDLPGDADDGRRRAGTCAGVAAAWRVACRQLYPAARPYHARPRMLPSGRAHVAWLVGRAPRMTASGESLCRHCLLPVGPRALRANRQRRKLRVLLLRLLRSPFR